MYAALKKKAKRGFRGYPAATIAFYGPDATHATKIAVGIVLREEGEVEKLERWFSTDIDIRLDRPVAQAVHEFLAAEGVRSVVMADRIIGCPHEEGVDYPEGEKCPQCPYWASRDRWSGEVIQ